MREQLDRCQALLDAAPALVWSAREDGGGTSFNAAWTSFTGVSREALEGTGYLAVVHPEDRDGLAASCAATPATHEVEFRLLRSDGVWRWMLSRSGPLVSGWQARVALDITERRLAEEAARINDDRMEMAQEAAGFGTYDWDLLTGRITLSPSMYRLLALDISVPPEGVYEAWAQRVHPDDLIRVEEVVRAAVAGDEFFGMDYRVLLPDGGFRWIEGRGRTLRDGEGRAFRLIGVNLDVTERRRAEEAVADRERLLKDIMGNFPAVVFRRVTYPDGRLEYPYLSNPEHPVYRMVRQGFAAVRTAEDALKLVHPDDAEPLRVRFRQAAETLEPLEFDARVIGDAGEVRWIRSLTRPRPREDGALVWDGVMIDVTEERVRESERERAMKTLELAVDVWGAGIVEYDLQDHTAACSPVVAGWFGLPEEWKFHPAQAFFERMHPDDLPEVRAAIERMGRAKEPFPFEYRLPQNDGSERWIAGRGVLVTTSDGRRRLIAAVSDVTEARRRDSEREAAVEHQQKLLRELNHRIKNNLQMITSVLRLQASRADETNPSTSLVRALARVETISDLHALLGVDGDLGPVDFADYLSAYCERLRASELGAEGISVRCALEPVRLDLDLAVPLGMIANELIMNAVAHGLRAGRGGALWIELSKPHAWELRLEIGHDGIAADTQAADGLGLQLVQGLCRQIGARREEGQRVNVLTMPLEQAAE